jgi:hypothetical protein
MPKPPFAKGRNWRKRASKATPRINRRVWYDRGTDYEYEQDPSSLRGTWHEIDWRRRYYRDIDSVTGQPVKGSEGQWRTLK